MTRTLRSVTSPCDEVVTTGSNWFIHAERGRGTATTKIVGDVAPRYTDEQLAEIEAAYDAEYLRGADTLYLEDVVVGCRCPLWSRGR